MKLKFFAERDRLELHFSGVVVTAAKNVHQTPVSVRFEFKLLIVRHLIRMPSSSVIYAAWQFEADSGRDGGGGSRVPCSQR